MKLLVTVSLGTIKGYKEVEVDINPEDYRKADGKLDRNALEETAQEILFQKVITWDWSISGEGSEDD
jgi:hypothetical protein